jgi:hypothetical protein
MILSQPDRQNKEIETMKTKKWSEMTEEERQAAVALRQEKLDQARQKLEDGVAQLVGSGRWTEYLKFLSHFHRYSFNNLILILLQFPQATLCASFRTWNQLGRHVRKGERGIEILVPILARMPACSESEMRKGEDRTAGAREPEDNADRGRDAPGYKVVGFKIGHTFDVSQTDGAPIPEPINMNLAGDDLGVYAALAAFAKEILHIEVELVQSDNPNWGGACSYDEEGHAKRIVVAGNRSPLFRAQTLAHELGHALLHSDKDYRTHNPRSRIECEAESVAFCILHHFGLDVGEVAFGYLAHWGDGENALAELMECGVRIRDAAHQVIAWIDEQYADAIPLEMLTGVEAE